MNTQLVPREESLPTEEHATAITPMQMLQIAVQQGADLDKLQKLMDLQERWEANEARKAFVSALNAFKADPPAILKDREIRHNDKLIAKYAGLDRVSVEVGKALSQHGLSHRWTTEQLDGGIIRVTCILTHERGHSERTTLQATPDNSGAKNSVQAIGSTVTYLERYTLLAATGLATTDHDDDGKGAGSSPITAEQKERIVALFRETNANIPAFLAYFKIENVDQLPAGKFGAAVKMLEAKKNAPAGAKK